MAIVMARSAAFSRVMARSEILPLVIARSVSDEAISLCSEQAPQSAKRHQVAKGKCGHDRKEGGFRKAKLLTTWNVLR